MGLFQVEIEVLPGDGDAHSWELRVAKGHETVPSLLDWARDQGVGFEDLRVVSATLEDVFLALTGRSLRE